MSFPRYEQYKNSGVEWLGEMPAHWRVSRLKRVAEVRGGVAKGRDLSDEETIEVPYLRVANVQDGFLDLSDVAIIRIPQNELNRYLLKPGDVLMNEGGDFDKLGRGHIWNGEIAPCIHQNHVFCVRPTAIEAEWLNLITSADCGQFYFMTRSKQSMNLASISLSNLQELPVPIPPPDERGRILAFIEGETTKIDGLVQQQRSLIELLKEKRQAVISHAVTKGLNSDVSMRPSGIECVGDAPGNWNVTIIKRFSSLHRGYDLTDMERTEGPYPVVTSCGISGTHGSFMVKGPGVVTGRYGSTGRLFFIEEDFWPHNTSLYVSEFHGNDPRFVWYVLQTVDFTAHSAKAAVPGVDRNDIHVLPVVVPPPDEQTKIVTYLDGETDRIDKIIEETNRAIEFLQERRMALISAAVTGKIDVRQTVLEPVG